MLVKGSCACDGKTKVLLNFWGMNAGTVFEDEMHVIMMKGDDKGENEGKGGEDLGKKKI